SSATSAAAPRPAPRRARRPPSRTRTSRPPTGSAISPASAPRAFSPRPADGPPTPDHRGRHRGDERDPDDPRGGERAVDDHAGERGETVLADGPAVLPRPLDRRIARVHRDREGAGRLGGHDAAGQARDRARYEGKRVYPRRWHEGRVRRLPDRDGLVGRPRAGSGR